MPSWGGKNRPLPDTGKRNMLGRQQDFAAPHKDGRPRRKAAQEGKAAKDTEDPLVKLERVVELLDRGLRPGNRGASRSGRRRENIN